MNREEDPLELLRNSFRGNINYILFLISVF